MSSSTARSFSYELVSDVVSRNIVRRLNQMTLTKSVFGALKICQPISYVN